MRADSSSPRQPKKAYSILIRLAELTLLFKEQNLKTSSFGFISKRGVVSHMNLL
jgi:hypothetical protein